MIDVDALTKEAQSIARAACRHDARSWEPALAAATEKVVRYVAARVEQDVRRQIETLHYDVGGECSVCSDEYNNPQDWPCQTAAIFLARGGAA